MSGPYKYYLGPWVWADGGWSAPRGTIGLVDLRGVPTQAVAGSLGDRPLGFFAVDPLATLGTDYTPLGVGDLREMPITSLHRDAWKSLLGYRPVGGTYLVDLLWDQLTGGGDPTGQEPTPPLMPNTKGFLELNLAGHSVVKSERYVHGQHSHSSKVEDVLQRQFRENFGRGTNTESDHARRVLDFWLEKFKLSRSPNAQDWRRFVPPELRRHIPGPLPHKTTITESFNKADGSLGPDLSWTHIMVSGSSSFAVASNQLITPSDSEEIARADSDLSSSDHYAECEWLSLTGFNVRSGPICRVPSTSTATGYICYINSGATIFYIFKIVSGTRTQLTSTLVSIAANDVAKIEADGSTIANYKNGSSVGSVTDTAITGGVRCGMWKQADGISSWYHTWDNFAAGDLAAGGGVAPRMTLLGVG